MSRKLFLTAAIAAAALPMTANAAVTACSISSSLPTATCVPFSPLPTQVGNNNQNVSGKIQYFAEKTMVGSASLAALVLSTLSVTISNNQAVASDFFVFDPRIAGALSGAATFSGKVLGVINTRTGLIATGPTFGLSSVTYNNPTLVGLESIDSTSFSGNQVNFNLIASRPGDSFRVLTAVPEPSTWMMMLFGFGVAGFAMRRRRQNFAASFS